MVHCLLISCETINMTTETTNCVSSCHKYFLTAMFSVFVSVLWEIRLNCNSSCSARLSKGLLSSERSQMVFTAYFSPSVLDSHVQGIFEVVVQAGLGGGELSEQIDSPPPPFSQHFKMTAVVYISKKTLMENDSIISITHAKQSV